MTRALLGRRVVVVLASRQVVTGILEDGARVLVRRSAVHLIAWRPTDAEP